MSDDSARFVPHPVLRPHYQSPADKQQFLRRIFDASAPHYEGIAKWGFLGSGHWYRFHALRDRGGLKAGLTCVDIATGTGPTARAMAEIVGDPELVTCIEPSMGMLRESMKQLRSRHIQAGADDLPLQDAAFDFLAMGFALRHVENLGQVFREFHRVLKPGGRMMILDVTLPTNKFGRWLSRQYFRNLLPWMTRLTTGSKEACYLMEYYWETMDQMVAPEVVVEGLRAAGFAEVKHHVVLSMFTEYTATKLGAG